MPRLLLEVTDSVVRGYRNVKLVIPNTDPLIEFRLLPIFAPPEPARQAPAVEPEPEPELGNIFDDNPLYQFNTLYKLRESMRGGPEQVRNFLETECLRDEVINEMNPGFANVEEVFTTFFQRTSEMAVSWEGQMLGEVFMAEAVGVGSMGEAAALAGVVDIIGEAMLALL